MTIQSVDRALEILDFLKTTPKGYGVTEIATHLQVAKSTAHRLLSTLEERHYIQQLEDSNYALGLKFIEMNQHVTKHLDILSIAHPLLEKLCEEVDEIVHLVQLRGDEVVYIDKVEPNQSIRIYSQIGRTAQLYCTGVGKVLLAYRSEDYLQRYLKKHPDFKAYTPYTVKNEAELRKRIQDILKNGYGFDDQEHELDICCVAAPIFDYSGEANYAISITSPTSRMTDTKQAAIIDKLLAFSKALSKQMGY